MGLSSINKQQVRLLKEKKALPDLLLIDGGKAHLLVASRVLKDLNVLIPIITIAKEKENIYSSQKLSALSFPKDSPAMNLVRLIRDEAHRFALGYHHLLRWKELMVR